MADESSSPFGWLLGLALLIAAVYFWRISVAFVGVLALIGLVVWAGYRMFSRNPARPRPRWRKTTTPPPSGSFRKAATTTS